MTDTKQKLPRFIKLVIWPDDYTTSTLVLHTEAPKYVARMERIKNNTELRVSVLKYQQDYMQCQKTNPAGLINEILLWDFQMHGEPSARIHLNTMENPGAIYVPTLMFAYEPPSHENQAIISVKQRIATHAAAACETLIALGQVEKAKRVAGRTLDYLGADSRPLISQLNTVATKLSSQAGDFPAWLKSYSQVSQAPKPDSP